VGREKTLKSGCEILKKEGAGRTFGGRGGNKHWAKWGVEKEAGGSREGSFNRQRQEKDTCGVEPFTNQKQRG